MLVRVTLRAEYSFGRLLIAYRMVASCTLTNRIVSSLDAQTIRVRMKTGLMIKTLIS